MEYVFIVIFIISFCIMSAVIIIRHISSSKKLQLVKDDITAGKNLDAIKHLEELIIRTPNDLFSIMELADLQLKSSKPVDALVNLDKLLSRDLTGSGISKIKVLLLAANAELLLNNNSEAYNFLKTAYDIDNTDIEVNEKMCIIEYDSKDYDTAFMHAGNILKLEPDNFNGNLYRGMSAYQTDNIQVALSTLKRTIQLNSNHFEAAFMLANLYTARGEYTNAEQYFKLASQIAENYEKQSEVFYKWGLAQKTNKKNKQAASLLGNALKLSKNPDLKKLILKSLIIIFEEEKNIQNTIWALKDYLKIDPNDKIFQNKMQYYLELNANTRLQKYEMLTMNEFGDFCKRLCKVIAKIDNIQDFQINKDGSVDILANRSTKLEHVLYQFRFIKSNTEIGEMFVRELYSLMKENKSEKAILVSNSEFTQTAIDFAENRVVTLIDKEGLLQYLDKLKD